jgi:ribosomal-protein-alanine N-acetyltransferase
LIGARVPEDWPPESLRDTLPLFVHWHEAHPDWTGWVGWYVIHLEEAAPVLCGSVGFKGPPDADGLVEIGFSLLPTHQHHGFATEMVERLVQWACAQPGVRCAEAETSVDNLASVRVLERTGFQPIATEGGPGTVRYRFLQDRAAKKTADDDEGRRRKPTSIRCAVRVQGMVGDRRAGR